MVIEDKHVASIHYTLRNDDGEVLDSSKDQDPLAYLHGFQNLVPGLEKELSAKKVGDKLHIVIEPEDGYGEIDPQLIETLPSSMFSGVDKIEVGMEFHAETQQGMQIVEIIDIDNDGVTVDSNHPLAGQRLHFDVEVMDIRDASAEELEHGHVHSPEGCGHEH